MIRLPYRRGRAVALALLALIAMSGCASTPKPAANAAAAKPDKLAAERGAVSEAMGLLYKGQAAEARKRLMGVLKHHPGDTLARSLVQQIDTPPQTLLGQDSFGYKSRADDSFSSLAQRFLGDPGLFYALARYNNLAPDALQPGMALRIPEHERPEPARPAPEARPRPAAPKPAEARPAAPPKPAATRNPQRALQLRAAGLEQMNRGAIDRAVGLLQQALQADPGNSLIQRDLDRAIRISRTVHAKP